MLSEPEVAKHCAALLEHFADYCEQMDEATRGYVVRLAWELIGDQMDRPSVRRTRRGH
ncbi:hypothetical protein EV378_5378 [Pseudonocardia endophytica]|uniref:Uncharacterized protein n=1 Tax=Pseudonocardia endophytica TaxID=401976 RepID=A0A4R1HLL3_PSEEN|nr:hypothetical protein EV378_5378 [Pseudonocardia endophytica]